MRNTGDNMCSGEQTDLVDRMIGTSYDIVKKVAYALPFLKGLASLVDSGGNLPPGEKGDKGDTGKDAAYLGDFSQIGTADIPDYVKSIRIDGFIYGMMIEDTTVTDADVAAHPLAISKTKTGRYFRRDPRDLWLEQFGARPHVNKDFSSWPAVQAALAYVKYCAQKGSNSPMGGKVGPPLNVGCGRFYLGRRTNVKITFAFYGQNVGHPGASSATIFDIEESGFLYERTNTLDDDTVPATTGSDGSRFYGISLIYVGPSAGRRVGRTAQFGLRAKCNIHVEDSYAAYFPGPNYSIWASAGAGGFLEGEASCSTFNRIWSEVGWAGLDLRGADTNVISVTNSTFSGCLIGVNSDAFLSSKFINCHFRSNGQLISYNGKRYQAIPGSEDLWDITIPGTNPQVWGFVEDGGPAGTSPDAMFNIITWTPGNVNSGRFLGGGPVFHINQNCRSSFDTCYIEGGSPLPHILFPAVSTWGQWTLSESSTADFINAEQGSINAKGFVACESGSRPTVGRRAVLSYTGIAIYSGLTPYGFTLQPFGDDFRFTQGNSDVAASMYFTGNVTKKKFGRNDTVPNIPWFYKGVAMGEKVWETGLFAPTSGSHDVGEIVWCTDPSSSRPVAYVCTVAGTPGTWRKFGAQLSTQPASTATDVPSLVADLNALITKLKAADVMAA